MTEEKQQTLGLFTFLPTIFLIWFTIDFCLAINEVNSFEFFILSNQGIDILRKAFYQFLILSSLFAGIWIYYLLDILLWNPKFIGESKNDRVSWILIIIFGGVIGITLYFFLEIQKREE